MYLGFEDALRLIHPAIAVLFVFPVLGIVTWMSWQTRQRRLQVADGGKSKIPPGVGTEHVKVGQLLAGGVVGLELIGITRPLVSNILEKQVFSTDPAKVLLIGLLYVVAISSVVVLFRTQAPLWRGIFVTLAGAAIVILSLQDGIYRRSEEWWLSHLYFGIGVTLLMLFSLAIIPEIYKDRKNRWRTVHIVLNCVALLLFIGQGIT